LASQTLTASLKGWNRQPQRMLDDACAGRPTDLFDRATWHRLTSLQHEWEQQAEGRVILQMRTEQSDTCYLNSQGDRLLRREGSSSLSIEHLDVRSRSIRFRSYIDLMPPLDLLREVQPEIGRWMQEGAAEANEFRSGEYPCLLSPAVAGFFIHEVVGHLFEADTETASRLNEHRGRLIAPSFVSIGEAPRDRFDDEGTLTGETMMIREGRIDSLLHSRETASLYGCAPSGNARSLLGHHPPIPRMQHTILVPGDASEEEMRNMFPQMISLERVTGGYSRSGEFVLQVSDAHLVENGYVTRPLGRMIVRGQCMRALRDIAAVGQQTRTRFFQCMKGEQNGLIVSATTPSLLLHSLWIGKN